MKILHCCLASIYSEGYGYQENIIPRYHQKFGYQVKILASTEQFKDRKLTCSRPKTFINEDNIEVRRVGYLFGNNFISRKIRIYKPIYNYLEDFSPNIIIFHDLQFQNKDFIKYKKMHPNVRYIADSHTDYINSGKNWISKNILHKFIYKKYVTNIKECIYRLYGTLPIRRVFYSDVYKFPFEKTELLVMGASFNKTELFNVNKYRTAIRKKLGINKNEFIVICGGKLDKRKNIISLIEAVKNLDIHLILFGSLDQEIKEYLDKKNAINVTYIGWLKSDICYQYFFASDLGIFPGTHSVLWEEAVGSGLPCIFRYWEGIDHVDLGGNCLFTDGSESDIKEKITNLIENPVMLENMKNVSLIKGTAYFSYEKISRDILK